MKHHDVLPRLFRDEHQRIIAELRYQFSIAIEIAEDLVGDTFLSAAEFWKRHGLPQNPVAWLHTVARNKARNHLKKKAIFDKKLSPQLKRTSMEEAPEPDIQQKTIGDSQLAMIFAICDPCISSESQVGLALHLLCGLEIQEIADAFFTTRQVIYKRLERAKEKLKINRIKIQPPTSSQISDRMENVLATLYLLFSEGYFSSVHKGSLRNNFCAEAMRLNHLLIEYQGTNTPSAHALLALMCFHASRFAARQTTEGVFIPYDEQNDSLWDKQLIAQGTFHLNIAASGKTATKFHLEAGIAYWHTCKDDTQRKWESILALYNRLLEFERSPIAALNRIYALAKVKGRALAIAEAEALQLTNNPRYHALLSFLYNDIDDRNASRYAMDPESLAVAGRQALAVA